jgi:hypothetical protein
MRTVFLFLALICAAGMALASDVSGNWKGQITTPNGDKTDVTYKFIQDGAKLTGSALGPHGDPIDITEGKVDGDAISFVVEVKMNGGMKIPHKGKIAGDSIELELHFGDDPPMTIKLILATS